MAPEPFSRAELLAAPAGFSHELRVRFQDVDAAGIVFFARILDYCHDAYVAFLEAAGCPLDASLREGRWMAPLVHAEADFIRPLRFGERLIVHIVAARLRETSYTLGYRLERPTDGKLAPGQLAGEAVAVGQTVHVVVDPQRFTRTAPPEAMRSALVRLAR
jgi:1,4-dihydroxy-2-naphthoyl-CoA hydrolase